MENLGQKASERHGARTDSCKNRQGKQKSQNLKTSFSFESVTLSHSKNNYYINDYIDIEADSVLNTTHLNGPGPVA